MELKLNIGYSQVYDLVCQLSETELKRLLNHFQVKYEMLSTKEQKTSIQELILKAPTWTEQEYNNFLEARNYINQSKYTRF